MKGKGGGGCTEGFLIKPFFTPFLNEDLEEPDFQSHCAFKNAMF